MLGRMLIQGLIATALIGGAAAVYAQGVHAADAPPPPAQTAPTATPDAKADNGYIHPPAGNTRDKREQAGKSDHHGEGREPGHKRHHDDDDD